MAFNCNFCFNPESEAKSKKYKRQIKLLLLGPGESGKSTFMKQMKIINGIEFNTKDIDEYRSTIYHNIIKGAKLFLDLRRKLNIPWEHKMNEVSSQTILNFDNLVDINEEMFVNLIIIIKKIWQDNAIMHIFEYKTQYQMNDGIVYFMENLDRIARHGYVPTNDDILHCRKATKCIVEHVIDIHGHPFRFVDVGGQRSQRQKWVQCFEGVTSIIFIIDSSSIFQSALIGDNNNGDSCPITNVKQLEKTNNDVNQVPKSFDGHKRTSYSGNLPLSKMDEARAIFETIVNNRFFSSVSIILFLNKTDLLKRNILLQQNQVSSASADKLINNDHLDNGHVGNGAIIAGGDSVEERCDQETEGRLRNIQKSILDSFLSVRRDKERPLFHHHTTAIDTHNIERVFNAVKNTILDKNLKNLLLA
ncbi:unnamed protein product [Gordionus sp. m RMFG-2023]